ncbi:MAG: hypothetical protein HC790_13580 [Acaryochloridaceae cyanobacterium CSU_3_4]|nr:hypothetical protein [Acaryochloridaceae cyanobacterium CSU_3_4]
MTLKIVGFVTETAQDTTRHGKKDDRCELEGRKDIRLGQKNNKTQGCNRRSQKTQMEVRAEDAQPNRRQMNSPTHYMDAEKSETDRKTENKVGSRAQKTHRNQVRRKRTKVDEVSKREEEMERARASLHSATQLQACPTPIKEQITLEPYIITQHN